MMEEELEQLVRGIIAENQRHRVEWSDRLHEVTKALANGEEIPPDRLEEILNALSDEQSGEGNDV